MDTEEPEKPRKSYRGWWIAAGVVVLAAAIVVLLWFSGQWSLQRKIQKLHTKGFPITFEEIEQKRRLPPGTPNAEDLYQKAFDTYQEPSAQDKPLLPGIGSRLLWDPNEPISEEKRAVIKRYLDANQTALACLRQAAEVQDCAFTMDYEKDMTPGFAYFEILSKCNYLLILDTIQYIDKGDHVTASKKIKDRFCMATRLNRQPFLFDCRVQSLFYLQNISLIEYLINHSQVNDSLLTELDHSLKGISSFLRIEEALRNEMPFLLAGLKDPSIHFGTTNFHLNLAIQSNTKELLDILEELVLICLGDLDLRYSKITAIRRSEVELSNAFHPITKVLIYALTDNIIVDLRTRAQIDMARNAIAVERYRLETGQLPEGLEELVPKYIEKVPIDLYDGKPLRYKRLEKGYAIYSVGINQIDEGGKSRQDYPFTVHR